MSAWPLAKELATVRTPPPMSAHSRGMRLAAMRTNRERPVPLPPGEACAVLCCSPAGSGPARGKRKRRPVRRHGLAHARAGGIDDLAAGQLHLAEEQGVLATRESEGGVEAEIERAHGGGAHQGVVGRGGGEFRAVAQRRARAHAAASASRRSRRRGSRPARFREYRHHGAAHHVGPGARLCAQQLLEPVQLGDLVVVDHGEEFGIPRHVIQAGIARVRNAAAGLLDVTHGKPGRGAGLRADRCGFAAPSLSTITTSKRGRGTAAKRCAAKPPSSARSPSGRR